jgi:branched-chain amino acid transport system substrate-binding protein
MQKQLSRIFALVLGIPLLLAILAACGSGTTGTGSGGATSSGPTTIKVATELPVSGADGTLGKSTENGAHLAVDQANANHTIPNVTLQFVPNDDVGTSGVHDPTKGAANVTSLAGDYLVAGVIGPFNSSVAKAELPITNQAPIAQISPSNTNDCLTQSSAQVGCDGANNLLPALRPTGKVTYFRVCTTDSRQGVADADFLYNTQHYKKAFVVDDTETYGVGLAKYFIPEWQKLGGTVIDHKGIKSTNSYVNLLTTIAVTKPDVIFFAGNFSTGGTLMRTQMLQVPQLVNTPFAGGDGIDDSTFAKAVGGKGGPVFASIASVDVSLVPAAKDFVTKFTTTYGPLGPYSASAYDAMNILIQGIKSALAKGAAVPKSSSDAAGGKTFRQAVIDAIQGITYSGVIGTTTFDANGDTSNKAFTIQQVDPTGAWKTLTVQKVP